MYLHTYAHGTPPSIDGLHTSSIEVGTPFFCYFSSHLSSTNVIPHLETHRYAFLTDLTCNTALDLRLFLKMILANKTNLIFSEVGATQVRYSATPLLANSLNGSGVAKALSIWKNVAE